MPATCLPLQSPCSLLTIPTGRNPSNGTKFSRYPAAPRKQLTGCRAAAASSSSSSSMSSSSITEFDLYELLGIESTSTQSQIKLAYRSLQKRCHPDIAGPTGHDMSIILNEAYALLSDPNSRSAYDKEQAKISELRGYTGRPMYSAWFGSESEQRAVFVDEVKCVGCLKCALFAGNTFAIESVYGRARVVAQWADPEHKIQEAIDSCPIDCISIVERSDLAALEFLMSKQPRGNVRVGAGNAVGSCVSNIFVEVKKFQTRVKDASEKTAASDNSEMDLQREARMSAVHAIRSLSNWLQWQVPPNSSVQPKDLVRSTLKLEDPNIRKLRDAAAARKRVRKIVSSSSSSFKDEYWIPADHALPAVAEVISATTPEAVAGSKRLYTEEWETKGDGNNNGDYKPAMGGPIRLGIPFCTAAMGVAVVRLYGGGSRLGRIQDHMGGSLALEIVNSSWLQVILAGVTWFLMGMAIVELVAFVGSRKAK
ncbi:hypothetical protein SAY86_024630 [Trapa natans]|uniref:J domain-containing protein n=1 Tax=Trapa natans TaxID=22666 RepID=A0AAN7REH6_TRANT|nr:hypothetical protein SAY86_024630 [Trapa natans]